jgi:dipeptidyl aminopeptidase/acylaminoacyl peptidase
MRRMRTLAGISRLLALLLLAAACNDSAESSGRPSEDPAPSPTQAAGPPASLVYLDGTTLTSFDLSEQSSEEISTLPSADVDLSPDGTQFVVVQESAPGGVDPDGYRQPEIVIGSLDGGGTRPLGPGRSPIWSPDSSLVAAIVPAAARVECPPGVEGDAEGTCAPEKVVAYDPAAGSNAVDLLGTEPRWFLVGWSLNQVVGIDAKGEMAAAAPGEPLFSFLGLSSTEVWDVSPTEQRFVTLIGGTNAQITNFEGHRLEEIELDGARLADGEWSPDGSRVAAVFLDTSQAPMVARLGVIDVTSGAVEFIPDEESAQGQVVWGADGSFAYVGTDPEDPARLQAVLCSPSFQCEPLFDWTEGIRLLGLV